VSSGYATEENNQTVYVYFTQNYTPGGVYYIEDNAAMTESSGIRTLFLPETGKQFCMSSIAADDSGTLYYSNDSGTLFALQEGYAASGENAGGSAGENDGKNTDSTSSSPAADSTSASQTGENSTEHRSSNTKKPGKPSHIRYQIKKNRGKYKVILRWKKGKNTTKTLLQIGKKKKLVSRTKTTIVLNKKNNTVRFYGYQSASSKSKPTVLRLKLRRSTT
jgi:hypothetical protein